MMGMIFLVSSSGYVLYTSNCMCTGEKQTSLFLKPETCETSFHQHHDHDFLGNEINCAENECHECQGHTKDCGCNSPDVFFFKLEDKVTNEEIKFVVPDVLLIDFSNTNTFVSEITLCEIEEGLAFFDSPPLSYSSIDFLVRIQQLKIPTIA